MAETAEDTDIGYKTLLKQGSGAGGTTLAEITELTPPEFSRDAPEFTHMESPDAFREYKPGLTDPGEVGITYNLIPGEATDDVIAQHFGTRAVDDWTIVFPNGAMLQFRGFATSHSRATPIGEAMTGSATFKVSGKPTMTPAAGG